MKKVLFVLTLDKFTLGFYKFIISNFTQQDNWFLIYGNLHEYDFQTENNQVFWCDSFHELSKTHKVVKYAKECDLIIYSGIFGSETCLLKFGLNTLKKSCFHFWGGDFYQLREFKFVNLKLMVGLILKKFFIKNVMGVINLIPKDYDELCKLCHPKGKNFIAPMCDDGEGSAIVDSLKDKPKEVQPIRILLGNSATETNQHIQAMQILEKFKERDIIIFCPLSYGDNEYRERIMRIGRDVFGVKFIPITEYMEIAEYYKMISECNVAIFNNNRQQAMGNISAALALGCKVFIRRDTAMWQSYRVDRCMTIYDVEEISNMSFEEFSYMSPSLKGNYTKYKKYISDTESVNAWKQIFNIVD